MSEQVMQHVSFIVVYQECEGLMKEKNICQ